MSTAFLAHYNAPKNLGIWRIHSASVHEEIIFPPQKSPKLRKMISLVRKGRDRVLGAIVSRWWFQTFFIFTPIWGNDPI